MTARGFTEIVFAYASCMANNGQNMAGLNANSPFYNLTTILAMVAGRFVLAALALELAGRFARQGRKSETTGTLPSDTITFGVLVLGTVVLIGALSFLPVLALGPIRVPEDGVRILTLETVQSAAAWLAVCKRIRPLVFPFTRDGLRNDLTINNFH